MRTIFKLIFLFNTVLLMAGGGPASSIKIVNLSGEDISFTISYNRNYRTDRHGSMATSSEFALEKGENYLSVSATEPHPYDTIYSYGAHTDEMYSVFNSYVNSIEIFDKNGKLIFNKSTYLSKRGLVFARDSVWDEEYGTHHPYGTYFIVILKTDLDRGGLQSSHRTTDRLNLRESPSTKAPVKKVINKGEAVAVTSIGEDYEKVNYNVKYWVKIKLRDGTEGWGVATYLTPIQ